MGLQEVLYIINMVVFAIGFLMPAVMHFNLSRAKPWTKRGGIGWMQAFVWHFFLRGFQLIKDDYDEAVQRTWDDRVKKFYPKLSKTLFMSTLAVMYGFVFFGKVEGQEKNQYYQSPLHRYFLVALTAECLVLYNRMKDGFDEDEEFKHFGRNFYMYYPFFDERKDLARSEALIKTSTTLKKKGDALQSKFKANFTTSLFHVALWGMFLSLIIVKGNKTGDFEWWQKILFASFPFLMTKSNRGFTAFLDSLQQYVFMAAYRLPIKSFKSERLDITKADIQDWRKNTIPGSKLEKAHYNVASAYFPLYSGFMHEKIYKPLRKDYDLTISNAMAVTTLAKGAVFVGTFAFLECWGEFEIELLGLASYYLFTAAWLKKREDGSMPGFDGMKLARKAELQDTEFFFFKLFHSAVESACVTTPLMVHICSKYGVPSSKVQ